jgi:hypothetical protein
MALDLRLCQSFQIANTTLCSTAAITIWAGEQTNRFAVDCGVVAVTESAVYALASAISMLARHASDRRCGPGDSPVSVALMSSVSPSLSSTAHHILVPGVPLIGEGVLLAIVTQDWKILSASPLFNPSAAWAKLALTKAAVVPKMSVFNSFTIPSL